MLIVGDMDQHKLKSVVCSTRLEERPRQEKSKQLVRKRETEEFRAADR